MFIYHLCVLWFGIICLAQNLGRGQLVTDTRHNLTFGIILPDNDKYDFSIHRVLPVIQLAILQVNNDSSLLPDYNINYKWKRMSDCSSTYGPLSAIEMRHDVQVFFGPVCDYDLAPIVRYSSASWEIPILTSGGKNSVFDNKTDYPMLTRMHGFHRQLGDVVEDILKKFNWKTIGLIFSDNLLQKSLGRSNYYFAVEPLFHVFRNKSGKAPFYRSFDAGSPNMEFKEILAEAMKETRIIALCSPAKNVRKLLLDADSMGMIDSGEYVFLNIELSGDTDAVSKALWRDDKDPENDGRARHAFSAVLTIRPRTPDSNQFKVFSEQVKALTHAEFGSTFHLQQVTSEAASFYEAVLLYVTALKEALRLGFSPKDGRRIHMLMRNRTLPGIGGNFSIDSSNDRHVDFSILDMEPTTGLLKEVAAYLGTDRRYVEVPFTAIHWSGGRTTPPPDEPPCGFDGAKCATGPGIWLIVTICLSIVFVLGVIAAILFWRHYRNEAQIAQMNWLVKFDELTFAGKDDLKRTDSRQSLLKMGDNVSMDTLALGLNRKQIFAPTACYKKQICAVKKLNPQKIVLSRPLLKEFKTIQSLAHDHIARFVAACFDSDPPCLLFEYCPRGSLEDVLENENITLDWMFRYSLMHDLVKGMSYLHSSELKTHGNLKSSNCVVDSRFVLKVTDYGPHCMRTAEDTDEYADSHRYYKRKLWTAPELLRSSRRNPHGTQKGDVYSFAIIAQEIVHRQGPFYRYDCYLEPVEIVKRVMMESKPPFRPTLDAVESGADDSLMLLIEKCWSEDPNVRPDFSTLRNHIRRLNRENESGTSLLDNLLKRMEQYADNLEGLVQERTSDYLEQKRKAEELLHQLLPRPVALQLISGQAVEAESFDSVTIYFSDIVGFTTLSALSTPLQVVNFLNDLYTCFDSITEHYDVYKVETIGDAYVVVSGLPVRNGDSHAPEIGRMSLNIIEKVKTFRISHRPNDSLRVRIGMHTGPCVAGVVGLKMPRYCLFGDTVNTASRMESNSEPLRIHISAACHDVLDRFGTFDMELRGELDVKGKGKMITYWLNGEQPRTASPTAADCDDHDDTTTSVTSQCGSHNHRYPPVSPLATGADHPLVLKSDLKKLSTSSGFESAASGPLPYLDDFDRDDPTERTNLIMTSGFSASGPSIVNGAGDFMSR